MSLDPNELLERYARDFATKAIRFPDLRALRSTHIEDLLGGSTNECWRTAQEKLRYFEFAAKAYGFESMQPASSIPDFLASQANPAIPDLRDNLATRLPRVVRTILGQLDLDYCARHGRHGPGVVADRLIGHDKWLACIPPTDLGDKMDPLRRLDRASLSSCHSVYYDVPKTAWSNRGICAEPSGLQFAQQGIGALVKRRLFGFSDLTRQEDNQDACFWSDWNTVDLSAASDTISVHHLDCLFSESPDWAHALMAHRSEWCLVKGELVQMQSIASMGNGYCFPLLTLVTVSIICSVLSCHLGISPYDRLALMRAFRSYARVYGDDIVLHERFDLHVRYALQCFGFRINSAKSSFHGRLRESCGVFVLDGKKIPDIVRIRDCSLKSPSSLVHVAGIQRRLYKKGMTHTASLLRDALHDAFPETEDLLLDQDCDGLDSSVVTFNRTSTAIQKFCRRSYSLKAMLPTLHHASRESSLADIGWGVSLFSGLARQIADERCSVDTLRIEPVRLGSRAH